MVEMSLCRVPGSYDQQVSAKGPLLCPLQCMLAHLALSPQNRPKTSLNDGQSSGFSPGYPKGPRYPLPKASFPHPASPIFPDLYSLGPHWPPTWLIGSGPQIAMETSVNSQVPKSTQAPGQRVLPLQCSIHWCVGCGLSVLRPTCLQLSPAQNWVLVCLWNS